MTTAPTHVDGLLPDDLEVFTTILTRHGRNDTLQTDIEALVEARFTAELLTEYDRTFGGSADFAPKSLIRLHQDGLTPPLAGAALTRGHLTANDAIVDFKSFNEKALLGGLSHDQARESYTRGLRLDSLDQYPVHDLADALKLHRSIGGDLGEILAIAALLPKETYSTYEVAGFLQQATSGEQALELSEVRAALEPHANTFKNSSQGQGSQIKRLMLASDPEVLAASRERQVPFSRLLDLVMAKPIASPGGLDVLLDVASGLPDAPTRTVVQLSGILSGNTHHVGLRSEERTPLWIDGPDAPYPPLDETLRRYRMLTRLDPDIRLRVIPLVGTPGAVAALEALMEHGGGPHLRFALDNLVRTATLVSDLTPQQARDAALCAANLLSPVSPEVSSKAKLGTLWGRTPEALLGPLMQYAAQHGPEATVGHLEQLSQRFALVPDQALFALVGAQEEIVSVDQICAFLGVCPQVSPQFVAQLVARGVKPELYQAIVRAAPFESAGVHAQLYIAITHAGVSVADAVVRLRQATDGNPLAQRAGLVAAACGRDELLGGPWGATELTQVLLDSDPKMHELGAVDWGMRPGPSLAWPDPGAIPLGVGAQQWTLRRAASEPWALSTSTAAHQEAALKIEQWRRTLFPDHPGTQIDQEQVSALRKSAYEYRESINSVVAYPSGPTDDPRWEYLHSQMLTQELAKDKPDFELVQALIRPDLYAYNGYGPRVQSREDAELLSALTLFYPELSADQAAQLMVEASRVSGVLQGGNARIYSVEYERGPLTDHLDRKEIPQGTKFDARYVYDFATAYPNAGATRLFLNFLTGQAPDEMPKRLQRIDRKPEVADWAVLCAELRSSDGRKYLLRDSRNTYRSLPQPEPLERGRETVTPVPRARVLGVLAPEGAPVRAVDEREVQTEFLPPAAHAQDSIGAYAKRISSVVDWYAGILIDQLQVIESAPALVDRRSEAFALIESALVRLQDHPLMQGSLDVSALGALEAQSAPADFRDLTHQLEVAMRTAWEMAVAAGSSYLPVNAKPNVAAKLKADTALLEAITLEVEIGKLRGTAEKLSAFSLDTAEGKESHAKAQALLERASALEVERDTAANLAQELAYEAERLARDTESIEKLLHSVSKAPILTIAPGVSDLPALTAFAQRSAPELPAPGRIRVSTAAQGRSRAPARSIR